MECGVHRVIGVNWGRWTIKSTEDEEDYLKNADCGLAVNKELRMSEGPQEEVRC